MKVIKKEKNKTRTGPERVFFPLSYFLVFFYKFPPLYHIYYWYNYNFCPIKSNYRVENDFNDSNEC